MGKKRVPWRERGFMGGREGGAIGETGHYRREGGPIGGKEVPHEGRDPIGKKGVP